MDIRSEFDDLSEYIEYSYDRIANIAAGIDKEPPTTVIMNLSMFSQWYYYCEERGLDHMNWKGRQIIIDQNAPFELAFSYHPQQDIMRKIDEKR